MNQCFWTEVTLNSLLGENVWVDSGCATQWDGSCSERQGNENVNDFWAFPFNSLIGGLLYVFVYTVVCFLLQQVKRGGTGEGF